MDAPLDPCAVCPLAVPCQRGEPVPCDEPGDDEDRGEDTADEED